MNISLTSMILNADFVVQFIMLVLLIFSLGSWTIILSKWNLLRKVRLDSEDFLEFFWKASNLNDAYKEAQEYTYSPEASIFSSVYTEMSKISRIGANSNQPRSVAMQQSSMDNLKRAVRKAENQNYTKYTRALTFLATTGSASPFIGLFGTVWGIMTSFHEIGEKGSASLAVVAPGISEALVVTAAGLFVAIPAVIAYNYFSNKIDQIDTQSQYFSTDLLNLMERDLLKRIQ